MQLYAFNGSTPIPAARAEKGKNYFCPECRSIVRLRSGPHRQVHFYHPALSQNCRQHQKSEEHLQLQLKLLNLIGVEEGQIECPFPNIDRIADVAWHAKKIVFEIQCSPIALEEVQSRNLDYLSAGYEVIWILHEKRFNRNALSAAESFLRSTSCYFTNIDSKGRGLIYDQFEVIKNNRRLFKGPPLNISLPQIFRFSPVPGDLPLPQSLRTRLLKWKYYVQGDLFHRLLQEGPLSQSAKKMLAIESRLREEKVAPWLPFSLLIARSYRYLLDSILKKLSR